MAKLEHADHLQFLDYLPNEPNVLLVQKGDEKFLLILNSKFTPIKKFHEFNGIDALLNDLKVIEKVRIYREGKLLASRQFLSDLLLEKGFNSNIVPNILFHAFEPLVKVTY